MPAFAQQLDPQVGGDTDHILLDRRLVLDFGDDRAHRRQILNRLGQPGAGLPPQLLELFIRQEHAAALFLEHVPQTLVGNVDRLFAESRFGVRRGARGCVSGRHWLSRGGRLLSPRRAGGKQ